MNAVARAWADVVVQERQKNNIIPDLEKIAEQYGQYERSIMERVSELRSSLQRPEYGQHGLTVADRYA